MIEVGLDGPGIKTHKTFIADRCDGNSPFSAFAVLSFDGLQKGAPADLTLFAPERGWKVDANKLQSISKNSPFDGRPVQGMVLKTIVDGRTVFEQGS